MNLGKFNHIINVSILLFYLPFQVFADLKSDLYLLNRFKYKNSETRYHYLESAESHENIEKDPSFRTSTSFEEKIFTTKVNVPYKRIKDQINNHLFDLKMDLHANSQSCSQNPKSNIVHPRYEPNYFYLPARMILINPKSEDEKLIKVKLELPGNFNIVSNHISADKNYIVKKSNSDFRVGLFL